MGQCKFKKGVKWVSLWLLLLLQVKIKAEAGLQENPYVTITPDGTAYTLEAGVTETEWYDDGMVVQTGVSTSLRELTEGEHYYKKTLAGEVPVARWQVRHRRAKCIHNLYVEGILEGVVYSKKNCYKPYFSGWMPYCADCGERVADHYFYMSAEAARSLDVVDTSKVYYYKCPHCDNLEQGVKQKAHVCKAISSNKYFIRYHSNTGTGYMPQSVHMYNNAAMYEGRDVTPQTSLSLNVFRKTGYVFAGWNTKPDGSGISYKDGATILNLTTGENACVELYAQWSKCNSTLWIDPAGGVYAGKTEVTVVSGTYGESYQIALKNLQPPRGAVVHFDTGGGVPIKDMQAGKRFEEWQISESFYGKLRDTYYEFSDKDGVIDQLTAVYADEAIVLPEAYREGYSFGGWYLDKECTQLIGNAAGEFIPGREMTLYAGWVDLRLQSKDNYGANQGKGAVDLNWSQNDNTGKVYLVYQRREDTDWRQIYSEQAPADSYQVNSTVTYSDRTQTYTIPYSGFYRFTLYGAQGGNYGSFQGGRGGMAEASIFLEKGEKVQCRIGGQNGSPGGGSGTLYGSGGGYSMLSTDRHGQLLVAGGGGGASSIENGMPGGSKASVMSDMQGENGACGGGGGYQGGCAGEVRVHHHDSTCVHQHSGTPQMLGGCYSTADYCGGSSFTEIEKSRHFYYGNLDWDGNHIFCERCGSDYCPGHWSTEYCYECKSCKTRYDNWVSRCTTLLGYTLGCNMDGQYICGMREGEIISSKAAYGGSNYGNTAYCCNYVERAGIKTGNGELKIVSEMLGIMSSHEWNGVPATDLAVPDKIDEGTIQKTAISESDIRVSFQKPKDSGTVYYHMVQSVDLATRQILCTSNETTNTLTSGVTGYYYRLDMAGEAKVDSTDTFLKDSSEQPFLVLSVTDQVQYLHIAPVDRAGNLGETLHIRISNQEVVYWPLMTEALKLAEGENVKPAAGQNTYYVRADGATPLEVEMDARVCGTATANYQIDYMNLVTAKSLDGKESIFSVILPKRQDIMLGTFTYPMQNLQKKITGEASLQDAGYTMGQRSNYCKNVKLLQRFTIDEVMDGQAIYIYPQAGAITVKEVIYSNQESDLQNGICLIADGQGPVLKGIEQLSHKEYLDFAEEEEIVVEIRAQDNGSGLSEFYVEINNPENGARVRYEDEALNGKISFVISPEAVAFHGQFSVLIYAKDGVGNETAEGVNLTGLGLDAYVERVLEPHDTYFKKGESGTLVIQTRGYVEKVEVFFPEDLVKEGEHGQLVYIYDNPEYLQQEQIEFVIPLTADEGEKTILVKAYKAGTELDAQPKLLNIEVRGSILDELRTRLR